MTPLSPNVATLQPSATMVVSTRARAMAAAGEDVLDLCVGEPDFDTPGFIVEAGVEAVRGGRTRYTPAAGLPELRAAVAAEAQRLSALGHAVDPQRVVISNGAKQALFNVAFTLFGPGDRVLVPVPYWTTYPALVELARAEPVLVPTRAEEGYRVTVEALERAAAGGVAGVMLNTPNNPSGAVHTREELEAIARWAAERGAWLVSDEIYRRISYREPLAPGLLDLPEALLERAVVVDGASKAFAMTGWRIGFSVSPPEVSRKIEALQSQTTSNPATPSQHAALAAYREGGPGDAEVERMRRDFLRRRDLLAGLLAEHLPGARYLLPDGAFYFWIRTEGLARPGEGSIDFCNRLLAETGVALVPGAAFGDDAHVRLSFAYAEETLREAVRRMARLAP